tara:strand:- start:794 stop:1231 length:438 start_codon:yes stop_codon:yes gene_type:complete
MMKKILLILFTFSSFSYGHSAIKGDFLGTWRLVEYAVDGIYQDVPNPTPIKMYMNGEFIIIFYLENKMHFNKGKYTLDAGKATETILVSSTKTLIGEDISFKPNFMGDKNSFYINLDFGDYKTFERWEKTHCDVVKCSKIRTRKD